MTNLTTTTEYEVQVSVNGETYFFWYEVHDESEIDHMYEDLYDENGNSLDTIQLGDYDYIASPMKK